MTAPGRREPVGSVEGEVLARVGSPGARWEGQEVLQMDREYSSSNREQFWLL